MLGSCVGHQGVRQVERLQVPHVANHAQALVGDLSAFQIPEDYQERLLEAHRKLADAYASAGEEKLKLEGRLKRAKRLFELGDYTEAEFLAAILAAKLLKYLRCVMTKLGFPPSGASPL